MKDYERLYQACKILDSYNEDQSDYNLNPDHDVVHLCFDVQESQLSQEHKDKLEELRCNWNDAQQLWYMNISC